VVRPLEIVAIFSFVCAAGVLVLTGERRSPLRQVVIGVVVGLTTAAVVLSKFVDLVPDDLELGLGLLGATAMAALLAIAWHQRSRD
jgi:protein-S-isoprenylcysteine O-methyltransferase Ste14